MINIVCVIDKSGSMYPLRTDTIGSFNKFLEEQKELPGKTRLTLVLFDHEYHVIYDQKKLKKARGLTEKTYITSGTTALLDAVGRTIEHLDNKKNTIFMIITDGYENSSMDYTRDRVRQLIEEKEALGWEFHYLGVGIDNFADAVSMGVSAANTVSNAYSSRGIDDTYNIMTASVMTYASSVEDENDVDDS